MAGSLHKTSNSTVPHIYTQLALTTFNTTISSIHYQQQQQKRTIIIPPEAPSYKIPPLPPQTNEDPTPRPRERGHLPIPRKIFRNEHVIEDKTSSKFLEETAPRSIHPGRRMRAVPRGMNTTEEALRGGRHDVLALRWRERSAEDRRKNLAEGIAELATRKSDREVQEAKEMAVRRATARRIAETPLDESERLTRPTVPVALLDTAVKDDPQRVPRALRARNRTWKMLREHDDKRRASVMRLYFQASSFIVDQTELEDRVEELFREDHFTNLSSIKKVESVWDQGAPPGLDALDTGLAAVGESDFAVTEQKGGSDAKRTAKAITRHKKVAEALTGGKLS